MMVEIPDDLLRIGTRKDLRITAALTSVASLHRKWEVCSSSGGFQFSGIGVAMYLPSATRLTA